MWKNYFYNIQKKYSMRVSKKEPLVIRLDGKDITKNKEINLADKSEKSFLDAMEKTVSYFTLEHSAYAIYGSDEVSFIFPEPGKLMRSLDSDTDNHSNEIISVFSQLFFYHFNKFDKNKLVFFHAKCFSIPEGKITSYIKYRSRSIQNVMATYILKRNKESFAELDLKGKIDKCKSLENYEGIKNFLEATLFYKGRQISLEDFLNRTNIIRQNSRRKIRKLLRLKNKIGTQRIKKSYSILRRENK